MMIERNPFRLENLLAPLGELVLLIGTLAVVATLAKNFLKPKGRKHD